jgi:hypothetical protein
MASRVTLDKAGIVADANLYALKRVRSVTRKVHTRSTVLCPVDTGRLRASGRMKVVVRARGPRGVVEYPVNYAAAVHDGSAPHIIKARRRKSLKFEMNGQTVYAKAVRHPGSQGRPFLRQAGQEVAVSEGLPFRRLN